jgi:hypothetical protein
LPAKNCSGKVFYHPPNLGWNELPEEGQVRRVFLALGLDGALAKKLLSPAPIELLPLIAHGWGNQDEVGAAERGRYGS